MPACGGERLTIWHQTNDARASARLENGAWWLDLEIGTWPIESGQSVLAEAKVSGRSGVERSILCEANWDHNSAVNSYWSAKLGPFVAGDPVQGGVLGLAYLERQRLDRRVRNCLECKRWSYGRIE